MKTSLNVSFAIAILLVFGRGVNAQVVTSMDNAGTGVEYVGAENIITNFEKETLSGREFGADGIINDWGETLQEFNGYNDDEIEKKVSEELYLQKKWSGNKGVIPKLIDEDGIDLYLLTEKGISQYMDIDSPVYRQEIDHQVVKWIRYYGYSKRKRTQVIFRRYEKWEPFLKRYFNMVGIPAELAELCLVESGCTYNAVSPVGAAGMWQIMPATGRAYGMTVNAFKDDRLDPVLSLNVATRIIKDSFAKTGDWTLAMAAYNCGNNRVTRYMKSGKERWKDIRMNLPKETQQYIPSILAMHYVWTYRKQLGFN